MKISVPSWSRRSLAWLSHYVPAIWATYSVVAFAGFLLPLSDTAEIVFILISVAFILLFVLGAAGLMLHDQETCKWCADRRPMTDDEGAAMANRWRWLLYQSHHLRFALLLMLGSFAFIAISVFLLPAPWSYLYLLTNGVWITFSFLSTQWHERLREWCPACKERRAAFAAELRNLELMIRGEKRMIIDMQPEDEK